MTHTRPPYACAGLPQFQVALKDKIKLASCPDPIYRCDRYPDWFSMNAKQTLKSLVPIIAKKCVFYATSPTLPPKCPIDGPRVSHESPSTKPVGGTVEALPPALRPPTAPTLCNDGDGKYDQGVLQGLRKWAHLRLLLDLTPHVVVCLFVWCPPSWTVAISFGPTSMRSDHTPLYTAYGIIHPRIECFCGLGLWNNILIQR